MSQWYCLFPNPVKRTGQARNNQPTGAQWSYQNEVYIPERTEVLVAHCTVGIRGSSGLQKGVSEVDGDALLHIPDTEP